MEACYRLKDVNGDTLEKLEHVYGHPFMCFLVFNVLCLFCRAIFADSLPRYDLPVYTMVSE